MAGWDDVCIDGWHASGPWPNEHLTSSVNGTWPRPVTIDPSPGPAPLGQWTCDDAGDEIRFHRVFLDFFVVSILVNTVLGIWALLAGDFGHTQGQVLGTSFLVTAAVLSVLVNLPAVRRRSLWPAPLGGAVSGASGFVLLVALVWTEPADDRWFKVAGSFLVVAAAATLASGLAMIPTPVRFRRFRPIGNALIGLLGLTVLIALWAEFVEDAAWFARLVGVQVVLVAAMTLLIPVLSRFSSPRDPAAGRGAISPGPTAVRFCPSCGRPVTHGPLGTGAPTVCDACGLTFEVTTSPENITSAVRR